MPSLFDLINPSPKVQHFAARLASVFNLPQTQVMSPQEQAAYRATGEDPSAPVQQAQPQQYAQSQQTVDPVAVANYLKQRQAQDAMYKAAQLRAAQAKNHYYGD